MIDREIATSYLSARNFCSFCNRNTLVLVDAEWICDACGRTWTPAGIKKEKKTMITKPMLAGTCKDMSKLTYPLVASPKLDGIRCLKVDGRAVSRTFKPIPNHHIRETLERLLPDGIDGEILVGDTFQECASGVMSRDGESDFTFWAFDYVAADIKTEYQTRLAYLAEQVGGIGDSRVQLVETTWINDEPALLAFEQECLDAGFEGVMTRTPQGPYKCGRATEKQQWLLKLKRFQDSEACILGFEERVHNVNELQTDELGYAKRSTAKAGKVPAGTLGKFLVKDLKTGVEFAIGTGLGLNDALRKEIWDNQENHLRRIVKYKYQPHGVKDAPRLPVWLGFRDPSDM